MSELSKITTYFLDLLSFNEKYSTMWDSKSQFIGGDGNHKLLTLFTVTYSDYK